jgi:hypothetical protein
VFHVQTEDSGPVNPRIFTHLYFGGTILASKRHEYDGAAAPEVVRALMQSQHKSILKDLKHGRHDAQLLRFFESRGETLEPVSGAPSADDLPDEMLPDATTPSPGAGKPAAAVAAPNPPPLVTPLPEGFGDLPAPAPRALDEAAAQAVLAGLPLAQQAADARRSGTPALGSVVRVERIKGIGTPTPTPVTTARPRRPAPSIPYVVQEGSHPVVAEAAPSPGATTPGAGPAMLSPAPVVVPPLTPPAPLVPGSPEHAPVTASLTAAALGATPTETVNREDSQSLDEVIMAYLSRGVGGGEGGPQDKAGKAGKIG